MSKLFIAILLCLAFFGCSGVSKEQEDKILIGAYDAINWTNQKMADAISYMNDNMEELVALYKPYTPPENIAMQKATLEWLSNEEK